MSRILFALLTSAVLLSPASYADEKPAKAEEAGRAPDTFRVKVTTSKGEFIIEVTREWAPLGADRFQ